MSSDLQDQLADLATLAPPATPPTDLWDRGVRRHRLDRAASAGVVVVTVLLVALGGWTWHGSRTVAPADTHGSPHLPDRFYEPSPWLGAFAGPPGQLIATGVAEHKTLLQTRHAVFGVTASSGRYGFVELPSYAVTDSERVETNAPTLSPDGHSIAFWTAGTPSGAPNTKLVGVTVTGVGVYDTTTGQVRRTSIATVHGLEPSTLEWLDDGTLVIGISQASFADANPESCCSGHWQGLATWQVDGSAGVTMLPQSLPSFIEASSTSAAHDLILFSGGHKTLHEIDPQPAVEDRKITLADTTQYAVLSPNRGRIAYVSGRGTRSARLLVARIPAGNAGVIASHRVPSTRPFERPVAWMDDRHVAVVSRIVIAHQVNFRLDRVDVRSGEVRTLISPSTGDGADSPLGVSLATDLLTAPATDASPPPRPWNLRWVFGLSISGLVCLVLFVWGARGRRA
jgi:hypothetical protein